MPGVTASGFEIKTIDQIRSAINARIAAAPLLGPELDTSDHSALGQHTGVMAGIFGELWELLALVYASMDPEAATAYSLTVLSSLTGTNRKGEDYSTVGVELNIDAGSTVPAGTRFSVNTRPDLVFALDEDVENSGGSPAVFESTATAVNPGPIVANAGTLTVIEASVAGLNSVTNPLDAEPGQLEESDITLRQRRYDMLALRGGSTLRAMGADLLDSETHPELDGIETVLGLENSTDSTNRDGVPAHSFEIVIDDGVSPSVDDDDIAQTIWDSKPAGIATFGDTTGTATDENGDTHPVRFSRREAINIYVQYTLSVGPTFPSDGYDQVDALILAKGDSLRIGDDIVYLQFRAAALGVTGVIDVPTFTIGITPSPVGTSNIAISARARGLFDSSRIAHP
jgi:hypothetical protein